MKDIQRQQFSFTKTSIKVSLKILILEAQGLSLCFKQALKLARKCEIKHWYACGADGRNVGWSVYGHVIVEFSRMDRFSIKVWGLELSP